MHLKRLIGMTIGTLGLSVGCVIPAQAASVQSHQQIVVSDTAAGIGYKSTLTIQLDKPVSTSTANQIKESLAGALQGSRPNAAGPTGGEFLVCNHAHSFSDSDGTFTIQHACGGTTGPWGYQLSTGLCSIVVSGVSEAGIIWTRNGRNQGDGAPHPNEYCRYQFHGNFNPEHDFDSIAYIDEFVFTVDVGGNIGSANLEIDGSFYSARCTNPSVCP